MTITRIIQNYVCYCGIEKEEYNALKKDAYVSNFRVWRVLHIVMAAVFGLLFLSTLVSPLMQINQVFYLVGFLYSVGALSLVLLLKEDSLAAQLIIYLSISFLFLFAGFITANKPEMPATAFIVLLIITPMFMIDKPYWMAFELCVASVVFLVWMHSVKTYEVWRYDLINVIIFTVVGIILHIVANSIRIKEFVLTRNINIQKDTDELTGLRNKAALTREINEFLADESAKNGIMLLLDVDRFKAINDTYGHDTGDQVIRDLGRFLRSQFTGDEITGRFGGDEFIVFLKNSDDPEDACRAAEKIVRGVAGSVPLPDPEKRISVSIGIAIYRGEEKNYSEIFTKADAAMYRAKGDPDRQYLFA